MNLLIPDKYIDLKKSLLMKTSSLINILKIHPKISIYKLYNLLKESHSYISDKEFLFAIDILYSFDKIIYDTKHDEIGFKK